MKLYQKIACLTGIVLLNFAGLSCSKKEEPKITTSTKSQSEYFAAVPMDYYYGEMTMTSADFDGDGDLDLIVGVKDTDKGPAGKLYFFKNDGKGNFTLYTGKGK